MRGSKREVKPETWPLGDRFRSNGREGLGSRWRVPELKEKEQGEEAWATASHRGLRFRAKAERTGCQRRRRHLEEEGCGPELGCSEHSGKPELGS